MSNKEYFTSNGVELPFHVQGSPEPLVWNRLVPRFFFVLPILTESMKRITLLLLAGLIIACSKMSPISANYQTGDGHLSAVVIDSSLFLMIGRDTMIIYDLKIDFTYQRDSNTYRLYKVLFSNSLNRAGYNHFEIPIKLEPDLEYGGTLTVLFINNDSFNFGGVNFQKCRGNNGKEIFDNWLNLLSMNSETVLRMNYPKE